MLMLYPVPGAVQIQGQDSYHVSGIAEAMVRDGACVPMRAVFSSDQERDVPFRAPVMTMRQKTSISPEPIMRSFIFVSFVAR